MGKYFGTDGFRGKANDALTSGHAYKIGRYLGWALSKERPAKVVIGKDTRRSGYMLEYGLVAGLCASGADAYLLHVTTTPSVSYIVKHEDFDCGIMISASHNPFYDNGIKLINKKGEKIEAEIEDQIEAYIDNGTPVIPHVTDEAIGKAVDYYEGREKYKEFLKGLIKCERKGLKVGIDCANGSASAIAPEIFRELTPGVEVIHAEPDGININRDCGSTHIEALVRLVKEKHLDVGFAFDGDADRCIAVNEKGEVVDGDSIMYLCGTYMKEQGRLKGNTVVTTVMSNMGLYKALAKKDIETKQTAVGDKYVSEEMVKGDYMIGGEQSGHIIFREFASTGDGILTALMILDVMNGRNMPLGDICTELRIYPQLLKNIRVKDKKETRENEKVRATVEKAASELGDSGRILVRESGTEQKLRVMVEADDYETCEKYVDSVIDVVKAEGLAE